MKRILIYSLAICSFYFSFGQSKEDVLTNIKDQMEIIDGYIEFETFYLDPEEFLDKMADHGAELEGYYEHERLKKIKRKVSTRSASIMTDFYFWNDQLIYVNYKQRPYLNTTNESGQKVLDYSRSFTKYESKHYFNNGDEIDKETIGSPLSDVSPETDFVEYANKMKALLDNKFYNKDTYEALQGKWLFVQNTDDYIIFEGTIRFNFYNGKFANRLKTKIDEGVLVCFFPMDDRMYRYKIENLDANVLTLVDLFSNEEFMYAKVEQ
ncbi:hypothetical protein M0D21_14000 [Aquimarina sp. D1M17]|uniref:hypothetical protein n=1 Tax=Aquimarina acroporae TaxID=2937283 RepID=UPI0020C15FF0|nr:hypothetical protein [Aquimarina acroporae]MCK8522693.1 hypothetical protein [Aquimarina acroporae]